MTSRGGVSTLAEVQAVEDEFEVSAYKRLPLAVSSGSGCEIIDLAGKTFLDFFSQHSVALCGHCPPRVVEAVQRQASRLLACTNAFYSAERAALVRDLVGFIGETQPQLDRVFLCNSGAEAVENALKMARRYRDRPRVVAIRGSFHGRSLGALSVTAVEPYRRQHYPLVPGTVFARFGCIEDVDRALTSETAAVIIEPIQGMGGVRMADRDYFQRLEELCHSRGSVLIFDEIQTGLGRTGRPFAADLLGVKPHMMVLAKGLGSGLPIGAVIMMRIVAETISPGQYGTTFGGGPMAVAAARATLEVLRDQGLVENAEQQGARLCEGLERVPGVIEVRGAGLMLGVVMGFDVGGLVSGLFERGIIVGRSADPRVVRLLPPLIIGDGEVTRFLEAFDAVVRDLMAEGSES